MADQKDLAVTAHTDFLATDLATEQGYPVTWRIFAVFGTAGKLHLIRKTGVYTASEILNGDTNLSASVAYTFDVPVENDELINLQTDTGLTVMTLKVIEMRAQV